MAERGFVHGIFSRKRSHITTLEYPVDGVTCKLLVVMYQFKGE